ncbi:MAG: DNA methyltransferase [Syntrophales bacterium]|jgi:site-specific DNA-methyltransferase (adenine-specific)|nr:DNA methyltransferase [Syntrophales bacterium]
MEKKGSKESQVRAPRNRTISLTAEEIRCYESRLGHLQKTAALHEVVNTTICQDALVVLDFLPDHAIDLFFADPPYNLAKTYNDRPFNRLTCQAYEAWLDSWIGKLPRILKKTASLYICSDWFSSTAVRCALEKHFIIRNRITWEREKGRGARSNWKNNSEDIWFATVSNDYVFNIDAVKIRRRVLAPYRDGRGRPKDWEETPEGPERMTHPSNIWTDLTVPFWSMPENTDHPTQKPEKLLARIILASSREGDIVLDPFLGSGTTSVTARKLGRRYIGVEIDRDYACLAEKRLALAEHNTRIQGYRDGFFQERNAVAHRRGNPRKGD